MKLDKTYNRIFFLLALAFIFLVFQVSGTISLNTANRSLSQPREVVPQQAIAFGGGYVVTGVAHLEKSIPQPDLFLPGSLKNFTFIQPSEEIPVAETKPRVRSFEIRLANRSFSPQPLKGTKLNQYFKSLNSTDDYLYIMMQFEGSDGDPSPEQIKILEQGGVKLYEYHGDHTYLARVPRDLLKSKSYDFIRWANVVNPTDKNGRELISLLGSKNSEIDIYFYDVVQDEWVKQLQKISGTKILKRNEFELTVLTDPAKIDSFLSFSFVKKVEPTLLPQADLDTSAKVVSADYVWPSANDASGVTVGIIDSGIQHNHTHFSGTSIYDAYDYVDLDNYPEGNINSHGTHVAGIVSGQGTYNGRNIKGISYRANLVIERILGTDGKLSANSSNPSQPDIWRNILDPDNDSDYSEPSSADIISASWGDNSSIFDGNYVQASGQVDNTTNGAYGKAVPVIFSAGNDGNLASFKVNPPATAKNGITVGSSADFVTNLVSIYDPNNLYVMPDSSRNTTDGRVKPDVLAPGAYITSSVLGNTYDSFTGTSMAAPHVAAIAAQILKQYPSLSPAGVKAFIVSETVGGSTTGNFNYNQGWGRVDAYRSVFALQDDYYDSYSQGTVREFPLGPTTLCYDIPVPTSADQLVTTLVWSDKSGDKSGDNSKTLYNDLDLYLKYPNGTSLSWTVNDDDVNNVEKYKIQNPVQGTWQACVSAVDLAGSPGSQDYAVKFNVIKRTTTPTLTTDLNLGQSSIEIGQATTIYASSTVNGLFGYDFSASLQVPAGVNVTSSSFDGTDNNLDKLGDIPSGGSRNTRVWTIQGITLGTKNISINVTGKRIDGSVYSSLSSVLLDVVNSSTSLGGNLTNCTSTGYDQCIRFDSGGCSVSIAVNHYTNVNNIKWGAVNDSSDPYVIRNYTFGWKGVDAKQMYYNIDNPGTNGSDGSCHYGGCDGEIIPKTGTRATVFAPGIASREEVLGYDDTASTACWVWFYKFNPNYGASNPIYTLSCFADSDCFVGTYCNKTGSWNNWACISQKTNGQSCSVGSQCQSGYCDNDGVGLGDDGWCFSPINNTFDSQEPNYCEVSTGQGIAACDERTVNENYTSCDAGKTYFADSCSSTCGGQDRDSICHSSAFASGCTAQPSCDGVVAGTGQCNLDCTYNSQPPTNSTIFYPNGGEAFGTNSIVPVNWSQSIDPDNWFVTYLLQYSNNSGSSWYNITSNYGYENKLNDSSTQKNLNFGGNQNKTIYVKLPKNMRVRSAQLDITGWAS